MARTKTIPQLEELDAIPEGGNYLIVHDGNDIKRVTYSRGKGTNAKTVALTSDAQVFRVAKDGSITPSNITFSLNRQNINESSASVFSSDPSITLTGTGNTRTLSSSSFGANTSVTITGTADGLSDNITIIRVEEGSDSVTTIVSNESHNFQADASGSISSYVGGGTEIQVYEGANLLTFTTGTATNGQYTITASGSSITPGSVSGNGTTTYSIGDPSLMGDLIDQAKITYTIAGKKSNGDSFSITKQQSFTKVSAGQSGLNSKVVVLTSDSQVFKVAKDGTITPSTITLTTNRQNIPSSPSFTSSPSITLSGSGDVRYVTSANFGSNTKVVITSAAGGYSDAVTLVKVEEGSDSVTTILSNESHTFQADASGSISSYSGGGTEIQAYEGANLLTFTTGTAGNGQYTVTASGSSITVGSVSGNGTTTYTLSDPSSMTATLASITYTIAGKKSNGDAFTITKKQSFTRSDAGQAGFNAKTVVISSDSQIFQVGKDGTITPSSITFTANLQNIQGNATFASNPSVTLGGSGNSRTLTSANFGDNTSITISATAGGITDEISVVKVVEGSDAITPVVSNEAHIFQADASASISSYAGGGTNIKVYEGATLLTYDGVGTSAGTFKIIASGSSIDTGSVTGVGTKTYAIGTPSNMDYDQATITFTISGSKANGDGFGLQKLQSFSKSKAGQSGLNSKAVILTSDAQVFKVGKDGTITPSTITLSANRQNLPVTPSFTASPTITLSGSGDVRYVTSANFGSNNKVVVTVGAGDYSDAVTLVKVEEGSDSVTTILSNESHTYQADASASISTYTGGETDIQVYEGATLLTYTTGTPAAGQFTITASGSSITAGSISGNGTTTAAVGNPSNMGANQASITYSLSGKKANGDAFSITKIQSFTKSVAGQTGANAKTVVVSSDAQLFRVAKDGTITPSTITFTANLQNISGNATFSASPSVTLGGSGNTRTLSSANFGNNSSVTISATAAGITDEISVVKVNEGSDAITPLVSNEAHIFQADASGSVSAYTGGGTTIKLYEGVNLLTYDGTGTSASTFKVTASGSSITPGSISGTSTDTFTIGNPSLMLDGSDVATITYTISGSKANGDSFEIQKLQSFSKSKEGQKGFNAKAVVISSDAQIFQIGKDGSITPSSITFSVNRQNITSATSFSTSPSVTLTGTGDTRTLSSANFGNNTSVTVTATAGGISDEISIVKVTEGSDSITPVVTNEAHIYQAANDGTVASYSGGGTDIQVYEGANLLTYENALSDVGNGEFTIVVSASSITAGSVGGDGTTTAEVSNPSSMVSDAASITYTITGSRSNGTEFRLTKIQSFSKSKEGTAGVDGADGADGADGVDGSNAKLLTITSDSQIFSFPSASSSTAIDNDILIIINQQNLTGAISASDITITDKNGNTITTPTFNNSSISNGTGQVSGSITFSGTLSSTKSKLPITISVTKDSLSDSTKIYKTDGGSDGTSPVLSILSNESHTLPADSTGTVSSFANSGTDISVFEGNDQLSYDGIGSANGKFTVVASGSSITAGSISADGDNASVANASSATADIASITYTISGKTAKGTSFTQTKVQSFSKSKQGSAGSNARAVSLTADSYAITFNASDAESPSGQTITLTATEQNHSGTVYYEFYKGASLQGSRGTANTFVIDTAGEKPSSTGSIDYTVKTYSVSSGGSVIAQDNVSLFGIKPGSNGSDGSDGSDGADGADAYTVILTNDSHTLPTTNAGSVTYTGSGTNIIVYKGTTQLDGITSGTPGSGEFKVTAVGTNISVGAISSAGNPVIVADHSSMTQDNASITYTVNVENTSTFTKTQSLSKSKQGSDGSDGADGAPGAPGSSAKSLTLTADSQVFAFDDANDTTATPSSIEFTVSQQNLSSTFGASNLTIRDSSGNVITDPTISGTVTAGSGQRTFNVSFASNLSSTKSKLPISVTASIDGLTDYFKVFKVEGGADGAAGTSPVLGILSNESHTLVANAAGTVSSYAGSGTTITVYEGADILTYDGTGNSNGTWAVSASGTNITAGSISDSGNYATVGNHSNMTQDSATVTYTITGKTADGTSFSQTRQQSFSKSKQGATGASGTDAKVVSLDASSLAITYNASSVETPSSQTITLTATPQNHSGTVYYQFLLDGVSKQNSTTSTFTINTTGEKPSANGKVTYTVKTREGSSSSTVVSQDSVSIYGIKEGAAGANGSNGADGSDGISAITAFLSNDSQTFPAAADGTVTSFTGGSTDIYIYQGITDVTSDYTITRTNGTGMTSTLSSNTVTVTGMSHDSGSISVNASSGSVSITKTFTLSKSKQGPAGANGTNGADNQDFSWANENLTGVGPASAGLLMTDTVFGFHGNIAGSDATLDDFTSYLDSDGNFYLGSGSQNSYLSWNNDESTLWISGSKARITVDQFYVGSQASQYISGANGNIEISSSNFYLDTAGNVVIGGGATIAGDLVTGVVGTLPSNENLKFHLPFESSNGVIYNKVNNDIIPRTGSAYAIKSGSNSIIDGNSLYIQGIPNKGSSAYLGNSAETAFITQLGNPTSMTTTFWVRAETTDPQEGSQQYQVIFEEGGSSGGRIFYMTGNTLYYASYTSTGATRSVVSCSLDADVTTHIAAVIDNTTTNTLKLYKDGEEVQSVAHSIALGGSNAYGIGDTVGGTRVGVTHTSAGTGYSSTGTYGWNGDLAQFRAYDVPLTAAEVKGLYLNPAAISSTTKISGDNISTGTIKSNNLSSTQGVEFDLNNEILKIGGTSVTPTSGEGIVLDGSTPGQPKFFVGNASTGYVRFNETPNVLEISASNFEVSASGDVVAKRIFLNDTAIADSVTYTYIGINSNNYTSFYGTYVAGGKIYTYIDLSGLDSKLDSSQPAATVVRLSYAPTYPIGAVIHPLAYGETAGYSTGNTTANIVIEAAVANIRLAFGANVGSGTGKQQLDYSGTTVYTDPKNSSTLYRSYINTANNSLNAEYVGTSTTIGAYTYTNAWTMDSSTVIQLSRGFFAWQVLSSTIHKNMTIGNLVPFTNNTYDVGNATYRFDDIYATNGTIQTSDINHKTNVVDSDLGLTFVNSLRPVSYNFTDIPSEYDVSGSVIAYTTGSRTHYGFIAQEVSSSLGQFGKTTSDFAGVISGSVMGLRYNELLSPMVKAMQEMSSMITTLSNKVTQLELQISGSM